ncbi:hypothetical protein PybrP1_001922 [[Pythium] brassicae (nom. inval.)]|nr:hypothetical protein PybrP1_001922 [[Pythium] brassicae (nom. inval.)]
MLPSCARKAITPAVEALSAEFEDIDAVLEALKALHAALGGRDVWLSLWTIRTISANLNGSASNASEYESNQRNLVLQEAVSAYIDGNCTFQAEVMKYGLTDAPEARANQNAQDDGNGCYVASLMPRLLRPTNQWVTLTPDVEFKHVRAGASVQFQFRSACSDAIDAFVSKAFDEHEAREAKRARDETERFYYEWIAVQECKRYRLSDSTTFANLFFEGKAQLIRTLDDFQRRVGKFAARRFAHRVGILLHGPSGSGKTSIAKAIAHYTTRHVVNIHASRIKSNREVADLLEDLNYSFPGARAPVELDFKDIVLVLEGVDEISFAPKVQSLVSRRAVFFSGATKKDDDDVDKDGDALTVQGFLTALDGMIDTPGRMIVMTANDRNRVNPALDRPGRVHHSVDLCSMAAASAQQMIEHYMDESLDAPQREQLHDLLSGDASIAMRFTAAEMEALCLESPDAAAVLRQLAP